MTWARALARRRELVLGLLLLVGCAGAGAPIRYTHGETTVQIDPAFAGRGCLDLIIEPNGQTWITVQQDGSSDWGGFRALVAIVPETVQVVVVSVMAGVGAPFELIAQAFGGTLKAERPAMSPPSPIHGCEYVLEEQVFDDRSLLERIFGRK